MCEQLKTAGAEPADTGEQTGRTGSCAGGSARARVGVGTSWYWEGSYHVAEGPERVRSRKPDEKDEEEAGGGAGGEEEECLYGRGSCRGTRWVPVPEL